jgi:hypothetical protein
MNPMTTAGTRSVGGGEGVCEVLCADSDWVAERFAEIINANWPAGLGKSPRRGSSTATAVRAHTARQGQGPRRPLAKLTRPREGPVMPPRRRERSPP